MESTKMGGQWPYLTLSSKDLVPYKRSSLVQESSFIWLGCKPFKPVCLFLITFFGFTSRGLILVIFFFEIHLARLFLLDDQGNPWTQGLGSDSNIAGQVHSPWLPSESNSKIDKFSPIISPSNEINSLKWENFDPLLTESKSLGWSPFFHDLRPIVAELLILCVCFHFRASRILAGKSYFNLKIFIWLVFSF